VKIFCIIPSRFASSRFEGKSLSLIHGKPMIQWVVEKAKKAACFTEVFVATDDDRIRNAVEPLDVKVVMTASDHRSGTDRVAEACEILKIPGSNLVVNLQGDQPMVDPRSLEQVVAPFFEDHDVDMSTLAFKIQKKKEITDPKDVKVVFDNEGSALYFSRSPIPFGRDDQKNYDIYKHLGVYAYTRKFLDRFQNLPSGRLEKIEKLEQLRALEFGHRIKVILTKYDSPEVDLPEDIVKIEQLLDSV
jgi:3-deoxy-manno-octulosonate cytidylyltransferase (CMP-KDO synthetase)